MNIVEGTIAISIQWCGDNIGIYPGDRSHDSPILITGYDDQKYHIQKDDQGSRLWEAGEFYTRFEALLYMMSYLKCNIPAKQNPTEYDQTYTLGAYLEEEHFSDLAINYYFGFVGGYNWRWRFEEGGCKWMQDEILKVVREKIPGMLNHYEGGEVKE